MSEGQSLGNPRTRSESKCLKCEDVMKQLKIAQEVKDRKKRAKYENFFYDPLNRHFTSFSIPFKRPSLGLQ